MKDLLEALKDSLGVIAVVFACAASAFSAMNLGEFAVLLIAVCAFILHIGLSITIKRMDKEGKK